MKLLYLNKIKSRFLLFFVLLFFIGLMIKITLQYIPYNLDVAFLRIKQDYINIDHWRWAFFIHVYTSVFVLFAGATQFSKQLLIKNKRLHRILGYCYSINILLITGPASLVMSFYANGGLSSKIAFVTLSILWLYYTLMAIIKAKKLDFKSHKNYMIRSYALTLSAITLRAWKFLIMNLFEFPPMDVYRTVAWLGWGLNLIIAEYFIFKKRVEKVT